MEKLSVNACVSYGWHTFKSSPLIFIGVSVIILVANLIVRLIQGGVEFLGAQAFGREAIVVLVLSTLVGIALSFLINLCKTAFYLRAHDTTDGLSLRALWHPYPYLKYVGTSVLLGIIVLLGLILLIIPGIILGIIFGFALYLTVEEHLSPMEALKESARLTKGNRVRLFLLGLALLALNLLGLLLLIVGLFVTLPVSTLAVVHAYRTLRNQQLPIVVA